MGREVKTGRWRRPWSQARFRRVVRSALRLSLPGPPSQVGPVQRPQVYNFTTLTIHSMPLAALAHPFSFCAAFGNIIMHETTFTGTVLSVSQHCGRVP